MNPIVYATNHAKPEDILKHLQQCSLDFAPPLAEIVNLSEFALKIYDHAVTFESHINGELVALASMYCNDRETKRAFINHICVLEPYRGLGISKVLIEACLQFANKELFSSVMLEVSKENAVAKNLYQNFGFAVQETQKDIITMIKKLEENQ
jgi:ribosomal protein S18 acetylase RimI-like enzyme